MVKLIVSNYLLKYTVDMLIYARAILVKTTNLLVSKSKFLNILKVIYIKETIIPTTLNEFYL